MIVCLALFSVLASGCDSDRSANKEFAVNYAINRNAKASWATNGAQRAVQRDDLELAEAYLHQLRKWHYGIPVATPTDSPESFEQLMAMANKLEVRSGRSTQREINAVADRDATQVEVERGLQIKFQDRIDYLISSNDLDTLSEGFTSESAYEEQVERVHRNLDRKLSPKLDRESAVQD